MADQVIHTWVEQIAADCAAAIATVREVHKGRVYGAGTMLLFEPTANSRQAGLKAERAALQKLAQEVHAKRHLKYAGKYYEDERNGLPQIGRVRDNERA